jgi:hypothetical protein
VRRSGPQRKTASVNLIGHVLKIAESRDGAG